MKFRALLCSFAFLFCTAAWAQAYEFHLLNGMVIKGELKDFKDCKFNVATDFGFVIIEPGKLDYIVVNQGDGHPQADCPPGFAVSGADVEGRSGPEPVPQVKMEEPPAPPEPPALEPDPELSGETPADEPPPPEPPVPLEDMTAPPNPLDVWSIERPEDETESGQ